MSIANDLRLILTQPVRILSILGSGLWNCRAVAQYIDERRRGDFFSVHASSLNEAEHELLKQLVEESSSYSGPIIEIGTLLGATTTRMAGWKAPTQKIHTVDNYSWDRWGLTPDAQFELVSLVLHHFILSGQVEQHRADKNAWFSQYVGEPPALVFCDAIHTYEETKADIDWARQVNAKIISGHDYSPEFPGVIQAVDEAGGPARLAGTVWALATSTELQS